MENVNKLNAAKHVLSHKLCECVSHQIDECTHTGYFGFHNFLSSFLNVFVFITSDI